MAKTANRNDYLPSVWDRLTDENLRQRGRMPLRSRQSLAELKRSVRKDLEKLLNTRTRCTLTPESLKELKHSIIGYGVPDFSGYSISNVQDREELRRAIEETIRHFEPRFVTVRVELIPNEDDADRMLHFRIDADIKAYPTPEPVVFDSALEPVTRQFSVMGKAT